MLPSCSPYNEIPNFRGRNETFSTNYHITCMEIEVHQINSASSSFITYINLGDIFPAPKNFNLGSIMIDIATC